MTSSLDRKSDLHRLASYRSMSNSGAMVFYTRLSKLGYAYSGQGLDIECDRCRSRVQIDKEDWLITRSRLRHKSGCVFESLLDDFKGELDGADLLVHEGGISEVDGENPVARHVDLLEIDGASPGRGDSSTGPTKMTHLNNLSSTVYPGIGCSSPPVADCKTWTSDYHDLFQPEYVGTDSSENFNYKSDERICDKNPGHFAYFNITLLKLEQIPTQVRCPEMLNVLKVMSDLTVRIVVSTTSSQRRNVTPHKVRVGTGFVIENLCGNQQNKGHSSWTRELNMTGRDIAGLVFIQTSRHLVYNDEEAQNTTVEFFYDSPDSKDIVSLEGKYLLTNTTSGDSQCLLVCECSDTGFIQRLNQLQREFFDVVNRLPLKTKTGLSKKLFMVHHPHGGPKVLSYGDYTVVSYSSKIEVSRGRPELTKVTKDSLVGPYMREYRKTLFYAADTCPGSCGAPILTFCPRQQGANGDVTYKLDIWMHNGVETSHKLGASNLKACTVEDLELVATNGAHEDTANDNASSASQTVSSSDLNVVTSTAHPYHQEVFDASSVTKDSGNSMTEGIEVKLLAAENRTLKNQLTCKVCFKSDIKDVFLPCGEFYACSDCSKLLTQCPSCGKQILATVTVTI